MKAVIQKVQLKRIDEIWKRHKPQGLGFSDNDAVIIDIKTGDGKKFTQTFYCRLKGDGTLGHSMSHASEKRQIELKNFITKYISKDKDYDIRGNINTWKGKKVEVEEVNGGYVIKIQ